MNAVGYPLYINGRLIERPLAIHHQPAAGLGAYVQYPVDGLGQGAAAVGAGLGVILLGGLILGAAGWFAGKAMAPTAASEGTYKLAGALSNIVAPGLGLGIVGGFALANKSGRRSVGG